MPNKTISVPEDIDVKTLQQTLDDMREEKEWLSWEAPERTFKKRDKDFWITAIAILILVSVILIFVQEFFLIVALGAALFLYYVLSSVPPARIKNRLTNRGVYFSDLFYAWNDLSRFWFKKVVDHELVFFETQLRFPREISLIVENIDKEKLKAILLKELPLVESSPRFIDKATVWVGERLPLEDKPKTAK